MKKLLVILLILSFSCFVAVATQSRDFVDTENDYLSVAGYPDNQQVFTWSVWVYKDADADRFNLLGKGLDGAVGTGGSFKLFEYEATDTLRCQIKTDGTSARSDTSTTVTGTGWHNVACVYDGTNAPDIYIDGVEASYDTHDNGTGSEIDDSNTDLYIGLDPPEREPLNGKMAYIQAWTTTLTSEQINQAMECPGSVGANLELFIKGNGNVTDFSSNSHTVTDNGTGASSLKAPAPCSDGGSTELDGATSYFWEDFGNNDYNLGNGNVTLAAWVKTSSQSNQIIFDYRCCTSAWGEGVFIILDYNDVNSNGNTVFRFFARQDASFGNAIGTQDLDDGAWHHVAATWINGGNAILYVDGVVETEQSDNTSTASGDIDNAVDNMSAIGTHRAKSGQWFNGSIAHVHIFNRVLTPNEIKRLMYCPYSLAPIAHYELKKSNASDDAFDIVGPFDISSAGSEVPFIDNDAPPTRGCVGAQ